MFPKVEGSYSWPAAPAHAGHPMEAHQVTDTLQSLAEEKPIKGKAGRLQ